MVSRKRIHTLVVRSLVIFCFLKGSDLFSIEYQPWIGDYLESEWRNSFLYQSYPSIAEDSTYRKYSSDDCFLETSLTNTVKEGFSLEVEGMFARTSKQSWGVDHFSLAGRYVWSNDVYGSPLTVTTGAVFTQAFNASVRDISSFHHGKSEAEFFLSIGKELSICKEHWVNRWWAMAGIGTAVQKDAPWIRSLMVYQHRVYGFHELGIFLQTLWGLGHKKLDPHHFHGYGSIQHQSVDLGIQYTYPIPYFGHLRVAYSRRLYARNFPAETNQLLISLLYVFGL